MVDRPKLTVFLQLVDDPLDRIEKLERWVNPLPDSTSGHISELSVVEVNTLLFVFLPLSGFNAQRCREKEREP
jgi:hypothetical protein